MQNSKKVAISSEFITLGQLLKEEGIIPTGGAAKWFLREHEVKVNGESEARRGRKLRVGLWVLPRDHTIYSQLPRS